VGRCDAKGSEVTCNNRPDQGAHQEIEGGSARKAAQAYRSTFQLNG
jgi:hypothetical protein